jgi:hypothetical protein
MAEIAYVATRFNPLFSEEMGIFDFLNRPDVTLGQALLLKFKPVNMDVLPLYIVLLLGFSPALWLLLRAPNVALACSAILYALALSLGLKFPAYPSGEWYFNPFAWQLLFVFGAWCALGGAQRIRPIVQSRIVFWLALAYLVLAFVVALSWHISRLAALLPNWFTSLIYPIDKTNLDVLRFAHFLALAVVIIRFVPRDWPPLRWPILRPAILCGQHSLEIFCLGVFLAFAGHFVFMEVSDRLVVQIAVSALGIATMFAVAALITWYKSAEGRSPPGRSPNADLAGGEA